jgi:hypothetical protein
MQAIDKEREQLVKRIQAAVRAAKLRRGPSSSRLDASLKGPVLSHSF